MSGTVEAAIPPIALTGSVDEGEIARLAGVVCSFRLRRQILFLSAITIERLFADAGYRGHNAPTDYKFRIYTSGQKRRLTPQIKRELRRRAAIEPVIGHLKAEHRMGRNYLAHHAGDAVNAVLAAAGYNFHLLLRWLELLLSRFLAAQKAAAALQWV